MRNFLLLLGCLPALAHAANQPSSIAFVKPKVADGAYTCPANRACAINIKVKRSYPVHTYLQCPKTPEGRQFVHLFHMRSKGTVAYDLDLNGIAQRLKITVSNDSVPEFGRKRETVGAIVHFCCGSGANCGTNYRR